MGFDEFALTAFEDGGAPDMNVDAAPGTRIATFGERVTSMVKNVTTDAYVVQGVGFDVLNFGAARDVSVYGVSERGFMRFDLSSLTSADVVLEATLDLYVENSNDQIEGLFQVLRVDESWTEGAGDGEAVPGVTWQSRDGVTAWASSGGTGNLNLAVTTLAALTGPASFPLLTSEVQAWIETPATNHGVMLMSADNGHWHLASRENVTEDARPQLRLVLMDP